LEQDTQDGAFDAALTELSHLTKSHPDLTVHEGAHPFTECATFADDIKDSVLGFQTPWHYVDQPYLDEPGTTLDDFDFTMPDVDVVDALTDLVGFLKGEKDATTSKYVAQIATYFPVESDQRSFTLRLIIHYLGDIH